jgi:hypothetical protein
MSVGDRLWDALTTVIKMTAKIASMAARMDVQQQRIEDLTARVIRLQTALEIALAARGTRALSKR